MSRKTKIHLLVILAVLAASVYFTFPLGKRINLGLDLKGGMHLVLKVETEKLDDNARQDAVSRAIEILRNRIDGLGVAEPVIQRQGEDQIIVQLPGITDRERAIKMIGRVAQLEFVLVSSDPQKLQEALSGNVPQGHVLKTTKEKGEPILLEDKPVLKGETVVDARVDINSAAFGEPQIAFTLNAKGAREFAGVTRSHIGEQLAIVLDGEVLSTPNIKDAILSGSGVITGRFTMDEAALLALALRSGSLPAPMHIEEERTIGPLLGRDSINAGIHAAIIGGILVIGFMLLYYLRAGLISALALVMNLFLLLGAMGLLSALLPESQVTLTLPGIAGIILTLGMAVDANVLINERIREEINNGRPMHAAITNGYNKAFSAIFDSNITTLFAAFMLFQFGSGPIKGFAVTLTIGLLACLFTAIFVTKALFLALYESNLLRSLRMLQFFPKPKINFISKGVPAIILSLVVIIAGMVNLIKKQDAAYGIDFAGGQIQEYRFQKPVAADEIRAVLREAGLTDVIIQRFDQYPENVMLRSSEDIYEKVSQTFKEKITGNPAELLRIEKVGPVVGKELRQRAIWAILSALAGILVYVGFRFHHFDFATGGVVALLHDVVVTLGVVVLMGRQVDLLVITALLTIAGYSINDTIVIYDRVRENMVKMRKQPLSETINTSVNETLGRTILTTVTTMLVVLSLYSFGGEVLNTFALCLLVGFVAGTYSTVFIVTPIVLAWQKIK